MISRHRVIRFMIPALLALAATNNAPATAAERVVKNASIHFITGDDGKDDTDVVTVSVANADGKFLERVFDAKQEIKPKTTFTLWLNKLRAEPVEKVKGSKITFRIAPQGDEHWVVQEAQLTVIYETGPPEKWRWGPFVLETSAGKPFSVEFSLTDDKRM